ncbi:MULTISPECIES: sce7725 family protein [Achromobacter]|uniref:Uncharacterized protein n=1 Tax=Achromobacter ruhlandii TaxID=72557 RepID=A0A2M9GZ31_9BURK|nr:sce7725 family protein [Achromobacter ruhlandii]PJM69834.1 ATP-binding protein [Achromobacter ruhlandii]CAB3879203.1 hypothetical protein LMG3328_03196 [Achromobacter ruhlandii]
MYFPYFRGKQFELITIRENAQRLADVGFIPIIEPVRENLAGLDRALAAICAADGQAVVVVNPMYGSLRNDAEPISSLLEEKYLLRSNVSAGVLLTAEMDLSDAIACYEVHERYNPSFLHAGFAEARALANFLQEKGGRRGQIFVDEGDKLYQRHFSRLPRVLIKDGFKRQKRNTDYPFVEKFSELHLTYALDGYTGFGDFLTVGDDYAESGGPAYSVAIHLTFIDPRYDNVMFVYHFKSLRSDTPDDPAGKFAEALQGMMATVNGPNSLVFESEALAEFRSLHARGHFPGLGYVKKLSMQHHIETLAHYFTTHKR